MSIVKGYKDSLKKEFSGYNSKKLGQDVLAGITVAAVALPLALAFGVSSGASAAAGLITAIFAGLIIGTFSGGSYQISGPTGAMTAILLGLVTQKGLDGVFIACFVSGIILMIAGLLKLGALVSLIPLPVITGFTSGIAIIIALGQVDNISRLTSKGDNTIERIQSYFTLPQSPNITTLIIGISVIVFMIFYPKKFNRYFPSSLTAIVIATAVNMIMKFDVAIVGEIPKTIILPQKLSLSMLSINNIMALLPAAFSIAALGLIESLLCGACAGRMKNEPLDADRELVAQGIGNMVIPLFGGVPATAAIARTSVAIKAGGRTRITSIVHSVVLLLSMFALSSIMSAIPLSALAGVLMVTAWRMNEWNVIKDIFNKKIKTAIFQFLITMIATVVLDLTFAILIGVTFSIIMFVVKVSDIQVTTSEIDPDKLGDKTVFSEKHKKTCVVYLMGPIYFGTAGKLIQKLPDTKEKDVLIFSMRGVTMADISGIDALNDLCKKLSEDNVSVYFTCVQPKVMDMFNRCGASENIGKNHFFWSTDLALDEIAREN